MDRLARNERQNDAHCAMTESIDRSEKGLVRKDQGQLFLKRFMDLALDGKVLLTTHTVLPGHRAPCKDTATVMTMRRRKATPLDAT